MTIAWSFHQGKEKRGWEEAEESIEYRADVVEKQRDKKVLDEADRKEEGCFKAGIGEEATLNERGRIGGKVENRRWQTRGKWIISTQV